MKYLLAIAAVAVTVAATLFIWITIFPDRPPTYTPKGALVSCAEFGKTGETCAIGLARSTGTVIGQASACGASTADEGPYGDRVDRAIMSVARNDADRDAAFKEYIAAMEVGHAEQDTSFDACEAERRAFARVKRAMGVE